jgi:uncharacterized phage protein (TIGR01671 family)
MPSKSDLIAKAKARGWSPDANRWVFGSLYLSEKTTLSPISLSRKDIEDNISAKILFDEENDWDMPNKHFRADVDPLSVGFFSGLRDKKATEIYSGDIVVVGYMPRIGFGRFIGTVVFEDGCFDVVCKHDRDYLKCSVANYDCEVIGNVYQNSGLLNPEKGKAE